MPKHTYIITDLGFGDSSKGATVDFLARQAHQQGSYATVVRHNGGPQAGHRVVTPEGHEHVFAQFGSSMFVPNTSSLISSMMWINPANMCVEADALNRILPSMDGSWVEDRQYIHEKAPVITDYIRASGRHREFMRTERHGSCGEGVGEAELLLRARPDLVIRAGELTFPILVTKKLAEQRKYFLALWKKSPSSEHLDVLKDPHGPEAMGKFYYDFTTRFRIIMKDNFNSRVYKASTLIFEGAQGVLLDETFGFHPHTTWSTTTARNAHLIAREAMRRAPSTRLGLIRAYATRHGAGPFPTENKAMTKRLPDAENVHNEWQRGFRCGYLDLNLIDYAIRANGGIDGLCVSHMDRMEREEKGRHAVVHTYADYPGALPLPKIGDPEDAVQRDREWLGQQLRRAIPVRKEFYDASDFLDYIQHQLRVPIRMLGYGPRASDRIWL